MFSLFFQLLWLHCCFSQLLSKNHSSCNSVSAIDGGGLIYKLAPNACIGTGKTSYSWKIVCNNESSIDFLQYPSSQQCDGDPDPSGSIRNIDISQQFSAQFGATTATFTVTDIECNHTQTCHYAELRSYASCPLNANPQFYDEVYIVEACLSINTTQPVDWVAYGPYFEAVCTQNNMTFTVFNDVNCTGNGTFARFIEGETCDTDLRRRDVIYCSTVPVTTAAPDSDQDTGLSSGAIVGIVIGILVFLICVGILIWCCCVYRKKHRKQKKRKKGGDKTSLLGKFKK